jgi:hypothetical protein
VLFGSWRLSCHLLHHGHLDTGSANAVSVIIYLLLAAAMQNEHFALALSVTHLEIMAQAMLTIIFVGGACAF